MSLFITKIIDSTAHLINSKSLKIILILILGISLFKNLSFPLLWNDEAETIMHAKRTSEYGYPKVYDGKNKVYPIWLPKHPNIAIDESTNAYLGSTWGMYYYGVIAFYLGEMTDDLYFKTFLIRFPFALLGFITLLLFATQISKVFNKHALAVQNLFLIIIIISVALTLHLREVRHYSINIAIFMWITILQLRLLISNIIDKKKLFLLGALLIISYNVFQPSYIILNLFISFSAVSNIVYYFIRKKNTVLYHLPIFVTQGISAGIVIPIMVYFKSFSMINYTNEFSNHSLNNYKRHILDTWFYLKEYYYPNNK